MLCDRDKQLRDIIEEVKENIRVLISNLSLEYENLLIFHEIPHEDEEELLDYIREEFEAHI